MGRWHRSGVIFSPFASKRVTWQSPPREWIRRNADVCGSIPGGCSKRALPARKRMAKGRSKLQAPRPAADSVTPGQQQRADHAGRVVDGRLHMAVRGAPGRRLGAVTGYFAGRVGQLHEAGGLLNVRHGARQRRKCLTSVSRPRCGDRGPRVPARGMRVLAARRSPHPRPSYLVGSHSLLTRQRCRPYLPRPRSEMPMRDNLLRGKSET